VAYRRDFTVLATVLVTTGK